jgi:hypothetical protein
MTKIIAPNNQYSGISASVKFLNGVGETDNQNLINWFKQHGYKVEQTEQTEQTDPPPDDDLNNGGENEHPDDDGENNESGGEAEQGERVEQTETPVEVEQNEQSDPPKRRTRK